ncbi:hypothetical protein VTI74DRAFT_399 [Chaetomium olivicolor]
METIVLQHGSRTVLMAKPATYQDLFYRACCVFQLHPAEISSFSTCYRLSTGYELLVELHESAYPSVKNGTAIHCVAVSPPRGGSVQTLVNSSEDFNVMTPDSSNTVATPAPTRDVMLLLAGHPPVFDLQTPRSTGQRGDTHYGRLFHCGPGTPMNADTPTYTTDSYTAAGRTPTEGEIEYGSPDYWQRRIDFDNQELQAEAAGRSSLQTREVSSNVQLQLVLPSPRSLGRPPITNNRWPNPEQKAALAPQPASSASPRSSTPPRCSERFEEFHIIALQRLSNPWPQGVYGVTHRGPDLKAILETIIEWKQSEHVYAEIPIDNLAPSSGNSNEIHGIIPDPSPEMMLSVSQSAVENMPSSSWVSGDSMPISPPPTPRPRTRSLDWSWHAHNQQQSIDIPESAAPAEDSGYEPDGSLFVEDWGGNVCWWYGHW